jgi:hypothetical protein
MYATVEQSLLIKLGELSLQHVAEVVDFVEFLAAKTRKRAALDRAAGHRARTRSGRRAALE